MLINIDCPIEVQEISIKRSKKKNMTYCECVFYNLSQQSVQSIKYTISCFDSFGEPVTYQESNEVRNILQELNVKPRQHFGKGNLVSLPNHLDTRDAVVTITEILFNDESVWKDEENNLLNIQVDKISDKNELACLQSTAGKDAICYPIIQEDLWICICGRVNHSHSEICVRCNREFKYITEQFTDKDIVQNKIQEIEDQKRKEEELRLEREQIRKEEEEKRKALEEEIRQEEIRKQTELIIVKKKKQKKMIMITACMICVSIMGVVLVRSVIRAQTYTQAMKYMQQDQFDKALSNLSNVPEYKDAKEKMKEAHYQYALNLLNQKEYTKSLTEFEKVLDYSDSKVRVKEVHYLYALDLLREKAYNKSLEEFQKVLNYKDVKEKIKDVYYQQGIEYLKSKQWKSSMNSFSQVKGYKNTDTLTSYVNARITLSSGEDISTYKKVLDILESVDFNLAAEFKNDMINYKKEITVKYNALLAKQKEQKRKELAEAKKKEEIRLQLIGAYVYMEQGGGNQFYGKFVLVNDNYKRNGKTYELYQSYDTDGVKSEFKYYVDKDSGEIYIGRKGEFLPREKAMDKYGWTF